LHTINAIRKAGMPDWRQQRGGCDVARPERGERERQAEEGEGNVSGMPGRQSHRGRGHALERAVGPRLPEQEGHRHQGEKQAHRKAGGHLLERHAADQHTDREGAGEGQDADVGLGERAQHDGHEQGDQRQHRQAHARLPLAAACAAAQLTWA
jgi:hypothetical protein